ncbi:MAG: SIS domain-containing protein [Alphaproteobacteria bacterium]
MTGPAHRVERYFDTLSRLTSAVEATDAAGLSLPLGAATDRIVTLLRHASAAGGRLMFVGNGGSAAIASHLAIDFTKNGGMAALAFNDGAALTCLANDLGYENVFAHQVTVHGRSGDVLIAISSSGRSPNILKAAEAARAKGISLLTLSGFAADNPLRKSGDVNLYVPSAQYGFVEITHLALCHAVLDLAMGWNGQN